MRISRMYGLVFCAFGLVMLAGCMEKPAPPPPPPPPPISTEIANAKRVFVSNLGSDAVAAVNLPGGANGCYNTFYASLQQWGHYQLVNSPSDAELIFEIHTTKRPVTEWNSCCEARSSTHDYIKYPAIISLTVKNASTHTTLWSTEVGFLSTANTEKTELKQFDQTIEALTNRLKAMIPAAGPTPAP
jgi:hypothetical protein